MYDPDSSQPFANVLAKLNAKLHWQLSSKVQREYIGALSRLVSPETPEAICERIVINYHLDHATVSALRDPGSREYTAVWTSWTQQVLRILQHEGLTKALDSVLDIDDLAQVATIALVRALPSFRYTSRFSTWAYQVIVQSAQNELRRGAAQKRNGRPVSLDAEPLLNVPARDQEHPERLAEAHLLALHALDVLLAQADPRLARVFWLCTFVDMRPEDVAPMLKLHPSRIRALLAEARGVLQAETSLRTWRDDSGSMIQPPRS